MNDQTKESTNTVSTDSGVVPQTNKERLHLLACGYLRQHLTNKKINPKDIGQIIAKFLYEDWKFGYFYDYKGHNKNEKQIQVHGIYDSGKTVKCNYDTRAFSNCLCFYRISFGMVPNSGIYKIKFKIDKIHSDINFRCNGIGITANTHSTNNAKYDDYWYCAHEYIAWSSCSKKDNIQKMPNGLICGYTDQYHSHNIFTQSQFVYKSNNQYYKDRLPPVQPNDTIILQYDSHNNVLSFSKSNDPKLDSAISNLPKDKTFYWIVGHSYGQMSITIEE